MDSRQRTRTLLVVVAMFTDAERVSHYVVKHECVRIRIFMSGCYNIDVVTNPNLPHTLIPSAPRVYSGVPSGFLCVFRRV